MRFLTTRTTAAILAASAVTALAVFAYLQCERPRADATEAASTISSFVIAI